MQPVSYDGHSKSSRAAKSPEQISGIHTHWNQTFFPEVNMLVGIHETVILGQGLPPHDVRVRSNGVSAEIIKQSELQSRQLRELFKKQWVLTSEAELCFTISGGGNPRGPSGRNLVPVRAHLSPTSRAKKLCMRLNGLSLPERSPLFRTRRSSLNLSPTIIKLISSRFQDITSTSSIIII